MRRLFLSACFAALVAAACGGDDADEGGTERFDAGRAVAVIEHLASEIGPRPAGSQAAAATADYLAGQLANPAFGVFRQTFDYELDPNRSAEVTIGGATLPASTAGGSAPGTTTGVGVDVATAAEIDPGSLAGKVAVAIRGGSSFREKARAAVAGKAVALVIANNEPGDFTASLGGGASIPVVTISGEASAGVLAAARSGAEITVRVPQPRVASGVNVLSRAVTAHACTFILMANYDSLAASRGANDNASGVSVLVELAHQFATRDDVPEICFAAMDAGLAGGVGAERYAAPLTVSSLPAVVVDVRAVGRGGRLTVYGDSTLAMDTRSIAGSLDIDLVFGGAVPPGATGSEAFRSRGVATLEITREGVQQRADEPSAIDGAKLREAALLIAELMTRLSATDRP